MTSKRPSGKAATSTRTTPKQCGAWSLPASIRIVTPARRRGKSASIPSTESTTVVRLELQQYNGDGWFAKQNVFIPVGSLCILEYSTGIIALKIKLQKTKPSKMPSALGDDSSIVSTTVSRKPSPGFRKAPWPLIPSAGHSSSNPSSGPSTKKTHTIQTRAIPPVLSYKHTTALTSSSLARVPPPPIEIREALLVKIPYPDPLWIPWDLKRSTKSWGEMEKCD